MGLSTVYYLAISPSIMFYTSRSWGPGTRPPTLPWSSCGSLQYSSRSCEPRALHSQDTSLPIKASEWSWKRTGVNISFYVILSAKFSEILPAICKEFWIFTIFSGSYIFFSPKKKQIFQFLNSDLQCLAEQTNFFGVPCETVISLWLCEKYKCYYDPQYLGPNSHVPELSNEVLHNPVSFRAWEL